MAFLGATVTFLAAGAFFTAGVFFAAGAFCAAGVFFAAGAFFAAAAGAFDTAGVSEAAFFAEAAFLPDVAFLAEAFPTEAFLAGDFPVGVGFPEADAPSVAFAVFLPPSGLCSPTAESRRTTTRAAPSACALTGDLDTRPA
ncbi:hypothetical protein DF19_02350 [Streptomyces olindensis]|nr:hypothetical protein DF19_02350 [Streptomyces olindensis]